MTLVCLNCHRGDHALCGSPRCECPEPEHHRRSTTATKARPAPSGGYRRLETVPAAVQRRPRKEEAPCCEAVRDPDGRPVLGWCGPDCCRRPAVWARMLADGTAAPIIAGMR